MVNTLARKDFAAVLGLADLVRTIPVNFFDTAPGPRTVLASDHYYTGEPPWPGTTEDQVMPAIVRALLDRLYEGWWRVGPRHLARLVLIHPADRPEIAEYFGLRGAFWNDVETDLGRFTLRSDTLIPAGTIRLVDSQE